MEISLIRNNNLISNCNISFKDIIKKPFINSKNKRYMLLGLSMLDLTALQTNGAIRLFEPLRELFEIEFFTMGFSIGTILVAFLIYLAAINIAPSIGEWLSDKEVPNWVYLVGSLSIIIFWCFGW